MIIGDPKVGKTAVLHKWFNPSYKVGGEKPTVGIDYLAKRIDVEGSPSYVHFWDLAGDPIYLEVRNEFYSEANGILLVYDASSRESFNRLQTWIDEGNQYHADWSSMILIGNKSDSPTVQVSKDEAAAFAKKYGGQSFQVSAKSGDQITEAFNALLHNIRCKLGDTTSTSETSVKHTATASKKK